MSAEPTGHDPLCGQFCDAKPPKCRGGDCTLCDEADCQCALIARVVERERGNIAESVLGGTAVVLGRPVGYVDDVRADRDREWVAALAAICDESFARNNAAVMTDAVLRVGRYAMPADTFLSWAASLAAARPAEGTAE